MYEKPFSAPRWTETPKSIYILCNDCKNSTGKACLAYPDGIPYEIISGEVDHHNPYKGDHGIQFEPKE